MSPKIVDLVAHDIRFPTSKTLDGSDAMNPDPDYSAAYVVLHTDSPDGMAGHGLTFTIGRGTDLCVAAARLLEPFVVGMDTAELFDDMGGFWRRITGDSQLRWIGPEKGAIHLATAAVVNAVWDLCAKVEGKPLRKLPAHVTPRQLGRCLDCRYSTDAVTPAEAPALLWDVAATKTDREAEMRRARYRGYTSSAGCL